MAMLPTRVRDESRHRGASHPTVSTSPAVIASVAAARLAGVARSPSREAAKRATTVAAGRTHRSGTVRAGVAQATTIGSATRAPMAVSRRYPSGTGGPPSHQAIRAPTATASTMSTSAAMRVRVPHRQGGQRPLREGIPRAWHRCARPVAHTTGSTGHSSIQSMVTATSKTSRSASGSDASASRHPASPAAVRPGHSITPAPPAMRRTTRPSGCVASARNLARRCSHRP